MTRKGKLWRKGALDFGCKIYYASNEKNADFADFGSASDEKSFQVDQRKNSTWFVLNYPRANTSKYRFVLHRCGCRHLKMANTFNWPKVIAKKRKSLSEWVTAERPSNPITHCQTCIG